MKQSVIIDTGVLVAYLNRRDEFHDWAKDQLKKIPPPLITCEAVIAESCFLMSSIRGGTEKVLELLETGMIVIPFRLQDEMKIIKELMLRYVNVPMSFADACLVRMSEQHSESTVLTIDSDFRIYRKNRRQVISVITPK